MRSGSVRGLVRRGVARLTVVLFDLGRRLLIGFADGGVAIGEGDKDVGWVIAIPRAGDDGDGALFDEFEQCEKEADDFTLGALFEEAGEWEAVGLGVANGQPGAAELVEDIFRVEFDGCVVEADVVGAEPGEFDGVDDALEGADEVVEVEFVEVERVVAADGVEHGAAVGVRFAGGVASQPVFASFLEQTPGVAEGAVLEELPNEHGGGIVSFEFVVIDLRALLGVRFGVDKPAFDFDERCGDDEELGGFVDVDLVEAIDVGEELVGDLRQGDVGDVEFSSPYEVKEEVERAVESVELDGVLAVRGGHAVPVWVCGGGAKDALAAWRV